MTPIEMRMIITITAMQMMTKTDTKPKAPRKRTVTRYRVMKKTMAETRPKIVQTTEKPPILKTARTKKVIKPMMKTISLTKIKDMTT